MTTPVDGGAILLGAAALPLIHLLIEAEREIETRDRNIASESADAA